VAVYEIGDCVNEYHHQNNGEHNRNNHNDQVLGQANRRNNRVDREHNIHYHNGGNCLRHANRAQCGMFLGRFRLDLGKIEHVEQLNNAFINQIRAAKQQHQIAYGESMCVYAQVKRK